MAETVLKVRRKGITILPKRLREAAGIAEDSEVKAKVLPSGILLRPFANEPVRVLEELPIERKRSSVTNIRRLRKSIDREQREK